MHYYKRILGDYAKKAGRLSMLQHGAYTLLIDACYDREQFPTLCEAIEWTWASTQAESDAVEFVLRKFFTLEDGLYVQKRIQEEIKDYHQKAAINRRIATEREAMRNGLATKRERSVNEAPPNHKPITNNQEPIEKRTRKRSNPVDCPESVDPQIWDDWLKLRKAKKAPVTETVVRSATFEATKAGMSLERFLEIWCARGSQGLEASWLKESEKQAPSKSFAEVDRENGMKRWEEMTGRTHPDRSRSVQTIEMEPYHALTIQSR